MTDATRAEICAVAIADAFADSMAGRTEIIGSPMGLLPTLGARLARLTSNPDLVLTDGEARILAGVPPLGASQEVVHEMTEGWMPFRMVLDTVVPNGRRHVMMGASQIDGQGNQNISAIGAWARPGRMLLGVRGAPGNTVNNRTSYWVPRQSARVFVAQVDVVSGISRARAERAGAAATRFHDLHRLITNLAVYDFAGPGGTVRLVSVHPGVAPGECQAASGFDLALPPEGEVPQTRDPTAQELVVIREVLDPTKLREREVPAEVTP